MSHLSRSLDPEIQDDGDAEEKCKAFFYRDKLHGTPLLSSVSISGRLRVPCAWSPPGSSPPQCRPVGQSASLLHVSGHRPGVCCVRCCESVFYGPPSADSGDP